MKKIYLAENDKKIAGVCGGIGESMGADSTLIRLIFVFLAITTAIVPLALTYLVAWLVIPDRPKSGNATGTASA